MQKFEKINFLKDMVKFQLEYLIKRINKYSNFKKLKRFNFLIQIYHIILTVMKNKTILVLHSKHIKDKIN